MKYSITFAIIQTGDFGLPEGDRIVVPTDIGSLAGPSLDTATGQLVGYGTLSVYRKEDEKINMMLKLPHVQARLIDSNLFCEIDAADPIEAFRQAMADVSRFLRMLSATRGMLYSARPLSIVDSELRPTRIPDPIGLGSFKIYDLPGIRVHIDRASTTIRIADERLEKATLYLQNALLLMEMFYGKPNPILTIDFNAVGLIVLELWKACTTIVGDPSVKKDRYQSWYRSIGIPEPTKLDLDKLNMLRNDFDVAHYSLSREKRDSLVAELPFAIATTRDVIGAYISHLESANSKPFEKGAT